MAIKSSCSKSMGDLLLKGWAMLAENCPSCQVPLMRDPKTKDRLCVNCQHVYHEGETLEEPPEEEDEVEGQPDAAEGQEEEQSAAPSDRTAQQASSSATAAGAAKDDTPWRRKQQSDQTAELLSEKMLQGWALLETSCPRCGTPLVRNKQKRMWCVLCASWVVSEADLAAAAAEASEQPASNGSGAAPAAAAAAGAAASAAPDAASTAAPPQPPAATLPPARGVAPALAQPIASAPLGLTSPAMTAPPVASSAAPSTWPLLADGPYLHQVSAAPAAGAPPGTPLGLAGLSPAPQLLSLLASTLEDKLWQAQRLMASTPASDAQAVRAYATLVTECLEAMAKVRAEARSQQHAA